MLSSRYSEVLGVPVPWIGVGAWSLLLLASVGAFGASGVGARRWLRALTILALLATLASGALLYFQVGVVRAWCAMCVGSALLFAGVFVAAPRSPPDPLAPARPLRAAALAGVLLAASLVPAAAYLLHERSVLVAKIDGEPLTEDDLRRGMSLAYHELQNQAYLAKREWIDRVAADRALVAEAKRLGTAPETLLAREIDAQVTVTDAEVDAWLTEKAPRISDEERRRRARDALLAERRHQRRQAYLDGLLAKHRVEIFLERPRLPRADLDTSVGHTIGKAEAPVRIVVFSEFQCPFCAHLASSLRRLLDARPDDVSVTFVHRPLDAHARSAPAAAAAECAAAQKKFWPFHDRLFDDPSALDDEGLLRAARAAGLDESAYRACLPSARAKLDPHLAEAKRLGIASVPTLFVNGLRVAGAVEYAELERLVDQEARGAFFTGGDDR